MLRTQIQLSKEQYKNLKALAARRSVSIAEIVRQAVDKILMEAEREEAERWARARRAAEELEADPAMQREADGATEVSLNHDKYLAEALGRESAEVRFPEAG